jgi:FAD/FMN-containing dehydrogenase
MPPVWTNWAREQRCAPERIERPRSEEELVRAVSRARRVRVAGAGHSFTDMEFETYFRAVEAIMDDYGGRPHWGKRHYQSAATLAPRYPEWERFQEVRRRLDPEGRFENDYTRRVLGPVTDRAPARAGAPR